MSQAELGRTQPDCMGLGVPRSQARGLPGADGLQPELGNTTSASPCTGIGSGLCPPGGDNPSGGGRLPRGCPSISAEGDFLRQPGKTPW